MKNTSLGILTILLMVFSPLARSTPIVPEPPNLYGNSGPSGLAIDNKGNVYATFNAAIRKIAPDGTITLLAGAPGLAGGSTDGAGKEARFLSPGGLAIDRSGNIYVVDFGNNDIRRITLQGVVTTVTVTGRSGTSLFAQKQPKRAMRFSQPAGVAVDQAGSIYVTDAETNAIFKIATDGQATRLAGDSHRTGYGGDPTSKDGSGSVARFYDPSGVVVDDNGNLLVADAGNNQIRKVAPDGTVTTVAGHSGGYGTSKTVSPNDGPAQQANFWNPHGLAVDPSGNIFVADTANNIIRKITPDGVVSTLAGSPGVLGKSDGKGAAAQFYHPNSIVIDQAGNLYVADAGYNSIRKITPDGNVTTFACFRNIDAALSR